MERRGIGMISPNYSVQDYEDLHLRVHSERQLWEQAIKIIYERFHERFFSTIHFLSWDGTKQYSQEKTERNGFAIMALNCLLIDTFYQFEYGLESSSCQNPITGRRGNSANYVAFLNNKFANIFMIETGGDKSLAELFYKDIRCGILHSAQTYGSSMLSCEGGRTVSYINKNNEAEGIRVEVKQISDAFEEYFKKDYIVRLKNGDENARDNFIKKMRYVCNIGSDV